MIILVPEDPSGWPNKNKIHRGKLNIQGNINTEIIYPQLDPEVYKWNNNCILVGTMFGGDKETMKTIESEIDGNNNSLETRISTEEVVRANGDSTLGTSLNSEISSRESGDLSLTIRLSAEEAARQSAVTAINESAYDDTSINTRVGGVESDLTSEISSEASSRSRLSTKRSESTSSHSFRLRSRLQSLISSPKISLG